MSLSYFNVKRLRRQSKQGDAPSSPIEEAATSPVLDEADEKFLERLAALAVEPEGTPPPLPDRPVTLTSGEKSKETETTSDVDADADVKQKKSIMSYFALAQAKFKHSGEKEHKDKVRSDKGKHKVTDKDRQKVADDLHSAAEATKSFEEKETEKEKEDITVILDQLNLAAVNNRVFSFSKESQELLDKFKLVLKDIVNGAPTAYNDLEKLLTDSENQLKNMYGGLPPFLQNLVKSLPAKITAALGPEILAAQAEKPGFDAKQHASASGFGKRSRSKKLKVPSLKSLVSAEGAVATMLKTILNFLKFRFPALMTGTNVLMSLAVFLLLFVFWYCHKRGRETRLERERLTAEGVDSALASSVSSFDDDGDLFFEDQQKGESSNERPAPPLIIHDDREAPDKQHASVDDMPSVLHLPEPPSGATPLKEELLREAPLKSSGAL
ncbi:uncharacterized protein BDR25DRAFT_257264 [Lindgomyces ingoldianus]|uniref:Uncharacterized protein n=1 Tax=Lindgomyces ingoldianus TaxID=673940 RepID=A0ACB6R1A5_9PLEO|nr:uncharacterized protein BDR25DRAFT_257264 [Lindgomyces ingoldianus]KAF2473104.1 hypothetical protein BDR25DRAFT_257264 [Lindgomyces ingoldianus]